MLIRLFQLATSAGVPWADARELDPNMLGLLKQPDKHELTYLAV